MAHRWTEPAPHAFGDAYLDWSRLVAKRRDMLPPVRLDDGPEYAPVLVRLNAGEDAIAARRALRDLVIDPDSPFLIDPTERATLDARIDDPGKLDGLWDEYMIYRRVGTPRTAQGHLFDVVDAGMPVQMDKEATAPGPAGPVPPSPRPGAPIVAILDDGIGFLNARFCRTSDSGALKTRFHALWLQALEQRAETPRGTLAGRILDTAEIDTLLVGRDERAAYAALNAALYPGRTRDETGFAATHGTHVLDLAAGADPGDTQDPARDWPLIGVQLPPDAIDDTSGTWFESYLVMGLRWILRQARQVDASAPVIVNASLGVMAGPKDGSRFVEYQVAREARTWEAATGQPVRVVWAFGNGYRSSQVAKVTLGDKAEQIAWRAQPDDETASFIEIHCRGATSDTLLVGLTAPDGTDSGLAPLAPGEIRSLERRDGAALARIYHVPARRHDDHTETSAHYVLALAPTRGQKPGEPQALPGAWTLSLKGTGEALIQVQRDDAIRGAEARGRQSYLDHPTAHDWDPRRAAYGLPGDGPITDDGTHNAFATADIRQVFSVGAAHRLGRVRDVDNDNFRPAPYSARGAEWSIEGPTAAMVIGTGAFYPGVRAAGTLSGSARRLAGTSAAAGRMTRALALSAGQIVENAGKAGTCQIDDLDPELVTLIPTGDTDPRLGQAIIDLPDPLPAC